MNMELPDDTDNTVYVSHKLVRQPKYKGKWKEKFLKFYLIDQSGREQLAATAEDTGDAHYIYTSSENFKNYGVVSCRNREELILWLEMVIKKSQMKAAGQKTSGENEHYNDFAGYQFVGHRLEKLILEDGRRCNRWYLVDSESNEHLAVVGKERCASDGHYDYKAEEPFASRYPLRCSNLQGVLRWVAHMITPQGGQTNNVTLPATRGTPLATNSGGNGSGDYSTPTSKSPARSFALQSNSNPSKRRKLTPGSAQQQSPASTDDMLVSRPRWAANAAGVPGQEQLEGSFQMATGEPQQEWDTTQQVKLTRARQSSMGAGGQGGSRLRDPSAPKERADQEDMLIADALVDLQQVQHKNQDPGALSQQHLGHGGGGGTDHMGQSVVANDMEGADPNAVHGLEEGGEMYTGNINQKLIFDPLLQCQWSMRARNAIVTKGKLLARMKAGVYVYDSEQQELVRLEDTVYNRMKSRIKDSFGKVFSNLAVEQNITDPCHPAFKVTPAGTVSVGLFATDHLGPGTILGDYLYRAVMETYAENEHYVMMDPTGKRALQEMYSMDLAFTSSWEGDALVALGHPARNTLACMNDYRALPQGNNKPQRRMCTNVPCNCHSYARRTPNVELLETIEITPQRIIIPHLLVLTKRRVAHGDEILWDFGADFWERYEALVRRVHYVESQSQELERMKQTVEVSQHQLTALQNYIYEREQVITKLQQVMAMHGLNAEQALQMQLPFQQVVQDANGRIITVDGSDPSAMAHASMPQQLLPSDANQIMPIASLPQLASQPVPAHDIPPTVSQIGAAGSTADGMHAEAQQHGMQALAFPGQLQGNMLPGHVAMPGQQGDSHKQANHLQLMPPMVGDHMTNEQMPLPLPHIQQQLPGNQLPEQLSSDAQFIQGHQLGQGEVHMTDADVARLGMPAGNHGIMDMQHHTALDSNAAFPAHDLASFTLQPVPDPDAPAEGNGHLLTLLHGPAVVGRLAHQDNTQAPASVLLKGQHADGARTPTQQSIPVSEPISWPSQDGQLPTDSPSVTYSTAVDTAPDQLQHTNPATTDRPSDSVALSQPLAHALENGHVLDSNHATCATPPIMCTTDAAEGPGVQGTVANEPGVAIPSSVQSPVAGQQQLPSPSKGAGQQVPVEGTGATGEAA